MNIYDCDEGLDIKFSQVGMWGKALYFSDNSNYSHQFTYSNGNQFQMFYVKVAIGNSISMNPNQSI